MPLPISCLRRIVPSSTQKISKPDKSSMHWLEIQISIRTQWNDILNRILNIYSFSQGKKNVLINPKWNIIFKLPSWRTTFFPSANKSRWTGILNVNVAFCSCKWESFVNLSNKTLVWIIDFFSCLAIFPKLFTIITIRWNIVSFFVYDLRNLFVLSTLFLLAFGTHSHIS